MSKSLFTKNTIVVFFIILLVLLAISAGASLGLYYYIGEPQMGENLAGDEFESKLKLGGSFSLEELVEQENYEFSWIESDGVAVEIYLTDDEKEELSDEIVSYDDDTKTFTVVGVGKGYIRFINNFDSSVSFTVPFETSFGSNDTLDILNRNYSSFVADGVVTSTEVKSISNIVVQDKTSFDLADFKCFENLKVLEIKDVIGEELTSFINFDLPQSANIYVSSTNYNQYVERQDSRWEEYSHRVFPTMENYGKHSVVLYKNGGAFADDNGMSFETVEVEHGSTLDLMGDKPIAKTGYQSVGWYVLNEDGTVSDVLAGSAYKFNKDTKLFAKWSANTYTTRLHYNVNSTIFDLSSRYDRAQRLISIDAGENFVHIGWAYSKDAKTADFDVMQSVENLTAENEAVVDLYAVCVYKNFKIQFYNWNNSQEYVTYSNALDVEYGQDVTLHSSSGAPTSIFGSFEGWALTPTSSSPDFEYGEVVNSSDERIYQTFQTEGILKLYSIIQLETYNVHYEANGGLTTPSTSTNLDRGSSLTLAQPIEKVGHKFVGWRDDAGYLWTSTTLYNKFKNYIDSNGLKLPGIDPLGDNFVANEGITTVTSENVILTAVWKVNTFRVEFALNGGNSVYSDATVTYNKAYSFSGTASKTGHTFVDMNANVAGVSFEGRTLSESKVNQLYAALLGNKKHSEFNETSVVKFTPEWRINTYKLVVSKGEGAWLTVKYRNSGAELFDEDSVDAMEKTIYVEYGTVFDVWSGISDGNNYKEPSFKISDLGSGSGENAHFSFEMPAKEVTITASATKIESCIATGTIIEMADGTQKPIEEINIGDYVLTWDFELGQMVPTMVVVVEHDPLATYKVVDLAFDDGTIVSLITEHGFFDAELNKFVYITDDNATQYIGHKFAKMTNDGNTTIEICELVGVSIEYRATEAHSMVTANQISHFANGYLSIAAGIEGLFNIFEVDDDMMYDQAQMQADIEQYGLYAYDDFADYVSYEEYVAFNGAYLKVAVGKGLTTFEDILLMIEFYLRKEV